MLGNANFLILDEPTNHLDIMSKEILEDALNSYEGTVLYVSHDRYFINRTAHRILDLAARQFVNYIGNYDYYLEKREDAMAAVYAATGGNPNAASGSRLTVQQPGSPSSAANIADSEAKLGWLAKKEEQATEQANIQTELASLYEEWETLAE